MENTVIKVADDIFVTVGPFKGKVRVDIRQFYTTPTGEQKPSTKGINMSVEEFMRFSNSIDMIKEAIGKY